VSAPRVTVGPTLALAVLGCQLCAACAYDPAPGLWHTKQEGRNLDCSRLTQDQARERHPERVPEASPRGSHAVTDALACSPRLLRAGERPARDEALLSTLRRSVSELSQVAAALAPPDCLWHVDAFELDPAVSAKIAVAARTELAERGYRVSDRVPVLAAGDLSVLATLPAAQAYPFACARYFAQASLAGSDAFLGLMVLDAREAQLHGGLCVRGAWRWLR
jgi:hypothetical protein